MTRVIAPVYAAFVPCDGLRPVLLVDDDADTLEALRLFLEGEGFAVVTAPSATDALALLDTAEPAAIVMDLHMPGMDGYEFRERQCAMRSGVPFLAVTGDGTPVEEIATRLGILAEQCLVKPVDPAHLVALLRGLPRLSAD